MISALATFWMAGNVLAAGLAWWVIPNTTLRVQLGGLDFQSWRLFIILCAVPSLSSAAVFKLVMPESPKFLIESGCYLESLKVFKKMFAMNHRGSTKPFPLAGLLNSLEDKPKMTLPVDRDGNSWNLTRSIKDGVEPVRQLFSMPLSSRSTALTIIFYCISFGYYGLWMWFPELFKRTEEGGSPCANTSRPHRDSDESCYPVKTAVYMEGFLTAVSNLPGNIFTIFVMDKFGGKLLLSASLLVSSVSVFFIWEVTTKTQSLVMCCVFSGVSVISWNALDVVGTELYPTQLRSTALGFFTGVGRVGAIMGNVAFGQLVDTNCAVPILCVSFLLLTSGLVALRLPKTKQAELT